MTTINLHQSQRENQSVIRKNGGFVFSLGLLAITVIALVGLKFYVPFAEGKSKILADNVSAENDKFVSLQGFEKVVDVQKRLAEISDNLQLKDGNINRDEMTDVLDHLGEDLNKGVVVSDFKYDAGKVMVEFDANNFSDVSRQILNFKRSGHFTWVDFVSVDRKENVIKCVVEMRIGK